MVADALFRKADHQAEKNNSQCLLVSQLQPKWIEEILASYEGDQEVLQAITILSSNPDPTMNISMQQGVLRYKGNAWVGQKGWLRQQLITTIHSSGLGGHSGVWATYQRLKSVFYWRAMLEQVKVIVQECDICQRCKDEQVAYPSLLQPLPIPEVAWKHISMDFIESIPKSEGKDTILVVIDSYSKFAHFISLSHPFTASQVARLFLDNVYKLHGLPKSIVTDRDKIFLSHFWKEFFKQFGVPSSNRWAN